MANALLFNYEYCSGCHSCEIACRNHLGLDLGEWGIKLEEVKPFKLPGEPTVPSDPDIEWIYQPIPTRLCDMCEERVSEGKDPACVHNCLAFCIEYGPASEMAARAEEIGSRVSIYLP